jgi:hypothetical protein
MLNTPGTIERRADVGLFGRPSTDGRGDAAAAIACARTDRSYGGGTSRCLETSVESPPGRADTRDPSHDAARAQKLRRLLRRGALISPESLWFLLTYRIDRATATGRPRR